MSRAMNSTEIAASPIIERGQERLWNWAAWSRLDGSDTGFPRKTAYYTPPKAGDTWLDGSDKGDETEAAVNYLEAEWVEALVLELQPHQRLAVLDRYINHGDIEAMAKRLHVDRQRARIILAEAERYIGMA